MSKDYSQYLAAEVINDKNIVTYRLLARAVGVHASEAKKMLYEFHRRENAKKAGSVNALYMLSGLKEHKSTSQPNGHQDSKDEEDVEMQSSPFPGSSIPQAVDSNPEVVRAMTLVREEQLEDAKRQYATVTGIHVYSVQASSLKNIELVAEVSERISREYAAEDPLITGKKYGVVENPRAKRRTGARPPLAEPHPAPAAKTKPIAKPSASLSQTASSSGSPVPGDPKSTRTENTAGTASASKPATLKKESSDIFKSFAKSKVKPNTTRGKGDDDVQVNHEGAATDSSARGAHSMPVSSLGGKTEIKEDIHMADSDDDDDSDSGFVAPSSKTRSSANIVERRTKSQKEEELRRKMFDDDEDDGDEIMLDATAGQNASEKAEKDDPDQQEELSPEVEDVKPEAQEESAAEEEPNDRVTVSNGRRRGKRRVMKKKTIKDAEGYLVSREEPVWESFSEDDTPVAKPKSSAPAPAAVSKKPQPAKKGQGNIMSFFGKPPKS